MLAFVDTEFTDLVIRLRLLSVGVVAERGFDREWYAEVTDPARVHATGWFGQSAMLPPFGTIVGAACPDAELGERLSSSPGEREVRLQVGEFIELAFGCRLDFELVDLVIKDSRAPGWGSIRRHIRPVNVHGITGFDAGKLATEGYFKGQARASAPVSRHHALCDARAFAWPARLPNGSLSSQSGQSCRSMDTRTGASPHDCGVQDRRATPAAARRAWSL